MIVESLKQLLTPEVRAFLSATPPRHATIATTNADGSPHQIVIWYMLVRDGEGERIVINSRRGRRWPSNLLRDGRANLAIYEGEDAVTLELVVEDSYDGDAAQADIAALARMHYSPADADEAITRFMAQERISFVLRPLRVHVHGEPR